MYYEVMTVCVAGLSNDRKGAVLVADMGVATDTDGSLVIKASLTKDKILSLGKNDAWLLLACNETEDRAKRIFKRAKAIMDKEKSDYETVEEIATLVRRQYIYVRNEELEMFVLNHFGLTFEEYKDCIKDMPIEILDRVRRFKMGTQLLLIAKDKEGYHMYNILDGGMQNRDLRGWDCIGSGMKQSEAVMHRAEYLTTLDTETAKKKLLEAKKAAEIIPAISEETNCIIRGV